MEEAAREWSEWASRGMLKAGISAPLVRDYGPRATGWWINSPRREADLARHRGTLSRPLPSSRGREIRYVDSIVLGKAYVNQGLREGGGSGTARPLRHGGWPSNAADLRGLPISPGSTGPAGFSPEEEQGPGLPLVDRATGWNGCFGGRGVNQLRIKDLTGTMIETKWKASTRRGGSRRICMSTTIWELA
jgi:hypothetical protein